jgi:hypothetical protein
VVSLSDVVFLHSWREKVDYFSAIVKHEPSLGTTKLGKGKAYYTTSKPLLDFNKQEQIDGTTGNAYFFNNIVVIDFRNKKFGVLKD